MHEAVTFELIMFYFENYKTIAEYFYVIILKFRTCLSHCIVTSPLKNGNGQ
jgi:hypothetical protein